MGNLSQSWISLPSKWLLEDVQAALNVVITAFSTLFMFVFVRFCWQIAAKRVARGRTIPLFSLVSVNTIGEVLDVAVFLKHRLFTYRYLRLLAQCFVVICCSAAAIFSGPIARYSSRRGTVIQSTAVPGLLVTRSLESIVSASVEWNLTYSRLERANFPRDQLVDYLPQNSINWVYNPDQWNNSWHLDCQYTNQTDITLTTTNDCKSLYTHVPGLKTAFSYSKWNNYAQNWRGFYQWLNQDSATWKDALLFVHATKKSGFVAEQNTYKTVNFMVTAVHLHGVPMKIGGGDCAFGQGNVQKAYYTKIECEVKRKDLPGSYSDVYNVAYPDVRADVIGMLPIAYTDYYGARFVQQSTSDTPISVITPDELVRFYQTYTVVKDLQYRQPVTRNLNVEVPVVQISPVLIAVLALATLLSLLGLTYYVIFAIVHYAVMSTTPESKLDWILLSIKAEDSASNVDATSWRRQSVTSNQLPGTAYTASSKIQREEFEAARYNGRETAMWFPGNNLANSEYGSNIALQQGVGLMNHGPARVVEYDSRPYMGQGPSRAPEYDSRPYMGQYTMIPKDYNPYR